jgi:response regulator RpfG family c-di-GMP phosphodiesterase
MENPNHTVLCVDDEPNILNALKRLLRKERYRLLTTASVTEGFELLARNDVHVVISDQRMPEISGTEFLKQVKTRYPHIIRIVLTGYTDVDSITDSINEGHIYKFFLKPWNDQKLKLEIRQALEQYDLLQANEHLHNQCVQQNSELRTINENLEQLVSERTQSLVTQIRSLQLSQAILEELPLPIVGIGSEMMIVMFNKAAHELLSTQRPLKLGEKVGNYFNGTFEAQLTYQFGSRERVPMTGQGRDGVVYEMELIPLNGAFHNKAMILSMKSTSASGNPGEAPEE